MYTANLNTNSPRVKSPPHEPWLMFRKPRPEATIRLFCFHHAGGAALAYRNWVDRMPHFVDVCPIQLPGRGTRMEEEHFTDIETLAETVSHAIRPLLDMPVALFGHSMGAGLAFAVAQALEREQAQVLHLFAAGRRPPLSEYQTNLHQMSDSSLTEYLRQLGGTPEVVFHHSELKAMVFSVLRADLEMNDHFTAQGTLQNVPISALGGVADTQVPIHALDNWQRLTQADFSRHMFSGGHFFVRDVEAAVIQHVSSTLAAAMACRRL